MAPKNIDQIVLITDGRKYMPISKFSKITLEEFLKSGFPYKEIITEGHDPIFYIYTPKTVSEFEEFTSIFHPTYDFYHWWWMEYGNRDDIWR